MPSLEPLETDFSSESHGPRRDKWPWEKECSLEITWEWLIEEDWPEDPTEEDGGEDRPEDPTEEDGEEDLPSGDTTEDGDD